MERSKSKLVTRNQELMHSRARRTLWVLHRGENCLDASRASCSPRGRLRSLPGCLHPLLSSASKEHRLSPNEQARAGLSNNEVEPSVISLGLCDHTERFSASSYSEIPCKPCEHRPTVPWPRGWPPNFRPVPLSVTWNCRTSPHARACSTS